MKFDLHTHCNLDPHDAWIKYSVQDLIDKASRLEYTHIALTCHDHVVKIEPFKKYAEKRGIVLIQGVERTIEGAHILLYDCEWEEIQHVTTLQKLREYRQTYPDRLIIAAHPFYPGKSCIGKQLYKYKDCFDAIEHCFFYTRWFNLNKKAFKFSQKTGIPLVANGDIHDLSLMGRNYTLANSEPTISIKNKKVKIVSKPLKTLHFLKIVWSIIFGRFIKQ